MELGKEEKFEFKWGFYKEKIKRKFVELKLKKF